MPLNRLSVHRFRNLPDLSWEIGAGSHLVVGPNGAGKTSLLEAVYLAATGRSFRTSQLDDCARRDGSGDSPAGFTARLEVSGPPLAELAVWWGSEGLVRTLDGKSVPLAVYLGVQPLVVWTHREDEILAGVPERRRRMIDAGLVAERPERVALLARYRRVLAHKRELLRRRQPGIEAWNRLLAESAAELARERSGWVERLEGRLGIALAAAGRGFPPVTLRYQASPAAALEGVDTLLESLAAAAAEEARIGRPCIGPHLDRLSILWGGVDVSRVASAGERKALGLLLAAAQASLVAAAGREPAVLADDVDAELDLGALEAVWRVLADRRQVLATSNRGEISGTLRGAVEWSLESARPTRKPSR